MFTTAPSPAITPLPTPFALPAALRNLLAQQAIPESASAPLITVILHPTSAFEPIYPQNTPIIPFISDGTRQPTPTDDDDSKKGVVNASGIASILQGMLHVPLDKITIDGKPVVLDDLGQVGNGGNVNVMVMNPDSQKTGSGQTADVKGAPNDDDAVDDDGPDAEPTTHSLDVDSLLNDDDTKLKPSSNNDSDGSGSDDSDSDDDSDSEIEIETDGDDDYKTLQLNISALVVALAAYTQAQSIGVHKRGLYAGEQPLVYAEDVSARAGETVATDTAAIQGGQVGQAPTVAQQAPSAQGALPQGPAGVQRVDAAQLLLPAQPTVAGLSNAVQAVSVPPAAQALAAPVAASAPISAAASVPVAAAPAVASIPAGVSPVAASIPVAVQAAPAVAPAAAQAPAAGPFAALNYSELAYAQPAAAAPAAPAVVAVDPAAAAAYAQQQYYPAVAAQSVIQQALPPNIQKDAVALQGGIYANPMPTAMLINNNPVVPQAVIPIDASLSELIAQAGAATSTSASASAEATTPLDDNGEEPASAGESADSEDADIAALRRKIKAKAHKAAHSAKSADADDAETESAEDTESTADDDAVSASPKARASGKKKSSKKSKAKDVAQDEVVETESGFDYKASTGEESEEASSAELDTQLGYKRIGSPHQRSAQGGLKDEAAKARAEAVEDARAAVLSEIRADASAEAAQHASAELHLDGKSVVRDEEASASHVKDDYETAKEYSHESDTAESEEYVHTRALEDEGSNSSTVERYPSTENTRRYGHESWANAHSTYGDAYYPNESSSASEDSYSHGASSYGDSYKDSSYEDKKDSSYEDKESSHGDKDTAYSEYKDSVHGDKESPYSEYKVHYSDATATVNTASEASSTYSDNSHTYSDNTYSPYEHSDHDESQKPLNFVNAHGDAAYARDAAGVAPSVSAVIRDASTMSGPHAVNELDPLSYGTQGYAGRNAMPLSGSDSFGQESVVVIGFPQATGSATSVAPAASTVMVTKVITPAVKVVYASNSS
ncbi:hypothetical protein GGH96_000235 [Coemansia sp. RSA 1972]|nr:hypothetical protein GGH96_000235 [Coemansia sp. RSA 1972]